MENRTIFANRPDLNDTLAPHSFPVELVAERLRDAGEAPIGLAVSLLSDEEVLCRLTLPLQESGRRDFPIDAPVHFEAEGGRWYACCPSRAYLLNAEDAESGRCELGDRLLLQAVTPGARYRLYARYAYKNGNLHRNYNVLENSEITVGRSENNDIVCPVGLMSRQHASFAFDGRCWTVKDTGSTHGVYLNDKRISVVQASAGDTVSLPGLNVILGCGFISLRSEEAEIKINRQTVQFIDDPVKVYAAPPRIGHYRSRLFDRYPRKRLAFEKNTIEIEAPPMAMDDDKLPLLMRMGSAIAMGGRTAMSGNVSMLASSVFMPFLTQQYSKEEKEEYERKRTKKYREYLDRKWEEMLEEKAHEEQVLVANYPPLSEVLKYPNDRYKLWERRRTDDDFLQLRLGHGKLPMKAEIEYQRRRFELEIDPLMDEMYDLAERKIMLDDVPIMLDIKENTAIGVLGRQDAKLAFVRAMLMRITLLYSYDEVKLVLLASQEDADALKFLRYLPHVWDDKQIVRYIGTSASDAYQIGESVSKALGDDLKEPRKLDKMLKERPYYIVFALDKKIYEGTEVFKSAVELGENCGVSVFALFDNLPKECSLLLNLDGGDGAAEGHCAVTYLKEMDKADDYFAPDSYDYREAAEAMRVLSVTELKLLSQSFVLPKTYTFLEMLGVSRVEDLNILTRWKQHDPTKRLEVPIGVDTGGSLFNLDLHQKYHGPHGLVAGTTGSGKSEFLLTYILSLAVNFDPNEVSFLLIDYKGGGLAGAFDDPRKHVHLPHLVGTITNLDGSAIQRSLVSMQSEMLRRQRVFNEAKSIADEGTMDIYTYQKLFRRGIVKEPMPHLFIISDEFAELKQQQPEFLDSLVSIARVGRSLGVHLILATQRPAGVVTDQILSNTKFRVCLKVQTKQDSMDMLKRPEASEIRETGRFYLQVGTNELFALGQSAWCGADYAPQEVKLTNLDESIQVIDNTGASILDVAPPKKKSTNAQSQLVVIVRALSQLAEANNISPRQLWLPVLPERIDIDDIPYDGTPETPTDVIFRCGRIDDPAELAQYMFDFNLTKCGNLLIVGEPASGKTTFIQTMLYALSSRYTPEQVNYYVLDYSSRMLNVFKKLPHCGEVLTEDDDALLKPFFELISRIAKERKALFDEIEADSYETACQIRPLPLIIVVIDNIVAMKNTRQGQKYLDDMPTLMKNTARYGIRFVITMTHNGDVTMRFKQELIDRISLHLRDKYDFADAVGKRCTYLPPDKPGRGLCVYNENPLEMQLAMFAADKEDKDRIPALKQRIEELRVRYAGAPTAQRLRTLDYTQKYEDFAANFKANRLPLGYALPEGAETALPLKQFSMLSLYFGNPESSVPIMDNFLFAAKREGASVLFMKRAGKTAYNKLKHTEGVVTLDANAEGVNMAADTLLVKIKERWDAYKELCAERGLVPEDESSAIALFDAMRERFKPIFTIYERYADIIDASKTMDGLVSKHSSVYLLAKYTLIYIIGCFYPEDAGSLTASEIYGSFNKEKLAMLFGGNTVKQKIVKLPDAFEMGDKLDVYNRCVMSYRNGAYFVFMPCGVKEEIELPEDERSIFAKPK